MADSEPSSLAGLPIVTEAFARTIRLVTTARLRESVLGDLVATDKELAELAEIEGATSSRLVAERHGLEGLDTKELIYGVPHAAFINASFAYAKPREPNRFSGPMRGAWYAGLEVETSLAEVVFHITEFQARSGAYDAVIEYAEMYASLAGRYVDLRGVRDHLCLHVDKSIGYPAGNALAERVRGEGLNGIIYPSVRRKGGTCIVTLWPHAVQSVTQGGVVRLIWAGSPEPNVEWLVK